MSKSNNIVFLNKLFNLAFIDTVWLFGSRVRGDNQERADIDLAIDCPRATPQDWSKVLDIIDESDTLLKIDCLRFDELEDSSEVKRSILDATNRISF